MYLLKYSINQSTVNILFVVRKDDKTIFSRNNTAQSGYANIPQGYLSLYLNIFIY